MAGEPEASNGGLPSSTGRDETPNEQRDRNWGDILQELRVMQTGTQIIAGFLLTLPFQQTFTELDTTGTILYLALVLLAASATCLMLVPVAMHRKLFGLQIKDRLVGSGQKVVRVVLWLIGLLVCGTTSLIFYVVLGGAQALVVGAGLALSLLAALVIYPHIVRTR